MSIIKLIEGLHASTNGGGVSMPVPTEEEVSMPVPTEEEVSMLVPTEQRVSMRAPTEEGSP